MAGHDTPITRRRSLAALLAAGLGAAGWKLQDEEADAGTGPAGIATGAITCVLMPEQTEGPYYIEGEKIRRNITEGRPGVPLLVRGTIVDASTCKPIKGAALELWHCDAGGVYSGFGAGSANRTFLRGMQRSDASGLATLQTIYPGWYPGRTVHIHCKVHIGGNVVHTGQLYFPDSVTDTVYKRKPYSNRPNRTTRNASDSIYVNCGRRSQVTVKRNGSGYVASITMGVHRS